MMISATTVRLVAGKKISYFREIAEYYLHHNFLPDVICILTMLVDTSSDLDVMRYLRLLIILKVPQCLNKI